MEQVGRGRVAKKGKSSLIQPTFPGFAKPADKERNERSLGRLKQRMVFTPRLPTLVQTNVHKKISQRSLLLLAIMFFKEKI